MRGKRVWLMLHAASVMSAVSVVSGFSQSNTTNRVVREYDAVVGPTGPADVPPNIVVPSVQLPLIRAMLQRSSTFRRQCLRIANTPDLIITIERGHAGVPGMRARTHIRRQPNGMLLAAVQVVSSNDFEELIAHEFEHVIEQLDGIDLSSRARVASTGVSRASGGANTFETLRAKRVGETVFAEVRRGGS